MLLMACLLLCCPVVVMRDVEPTCEHAELIRNALKDNSLSRDCSSSCFLGSGKESRQILASIAVMEIEPQVDNSPSAGKVGWWLSTRIPFVGDF